MGYLNSFYIDRCFYVTLPSVRRVFKRVAMKWMLLSQGIILGADLPLFDGVKEDAQEQHGYHNTDGA